MAKLNANQLLAIEYLVHNNDLNFEQVAEKVGVTDRTLRNWRANDDFNDELKRQVMRRAVGDLPRVMRSIPDHIVEEGNAAMFRTYMQSLGLLTEKHEIESKDNGNSDIDAMKAQIAAFKERSGNE